MAEVLTLLERIQRNQDDIIRRLVRLEDKLDNISVAGGQSKPLVPEAILTCVQCKSEYKESENGDGSCKYHTSKLTGFHRYTYSCCNANSPSYESALALTGCTKGRHRSEHHDEYTYSAYFSYMSKVSNNAKELWLLLEALDPVSECYLWAEAGLTEKGKVYVMLGENRVTPLAVKELSLADVQAFPDGFVVLLERKGVSGWISKCSLVKSDGVPQGIELSVKPSLMDSAEVQRVSVLVDGDKMTAGPVEVISTLQIQQEAVEYDLPKEEKKGPFMDSGFDYSKNRKNNYQSESSDGCPLEVLQRGQTKVSSTQSDKEGNWLNKFMADFQVTNPSNERLAVTDITGHYMDEAGEWVSCDQVLLGFELFQGSYQWEDKPNFNINHCSTGNVTVSLGITIKDYPSPSNDYTNRAHFSLPQPLHLRVSLKDQMGHSVSVRFEQGNSALDLPNAEKRSQSWAKDGKLLGYSFVDDADEKKRYDAALFYDSEGVLNFRHEAYSHYIEHPLRIAAMKAKLEGKTEYCLEEQCRETKYMTLRALAMVDPKQQRTYGIKVEMKTATSSVVSYWRVPYESEPTEDCLTVDPEEVIPSGTVTLKWNLPKASKADRMYVYSRNGTKHLPGIYAVNKTGELSGEASVKAPTVPGVYEARYHPAWLSGTQNGFKNDKYWGKARFTVKS